MRVNFKHMINGYTGIADGSVYYYNRQTNRIYVRSLPNRKPDKTNKDFASKMTNIGKWNPDFYYKEDWQMYVGYYNALPIYCNTPVTAWNNLFVKVLFAMEKQLPDVDLHTLTKQQIIDRNLPCISLKHAVETGFLPVTLGYERFDHRI